jgi:hypothetical protein
MKYFGYWISIHGHGVDEPVIEREMVLGVQSQVKFG